ncbi:uncharacterized protein LOC132611962 [Lycium barbarum]|uniref:uncharacterized protein LOC132611962 n=1 Tax=Lycium barbarum TaxID=112863 RepID=UPI00293EFE2D|nr:uncharacterized protein LOC132611962 [Lycium barbarum]
MVAKFKFRCTNNMAAYEACILGLRMALDMDINKLLDEFADVLATIASMILHLESSHIDPLRIILKEEHAHCFHVEAEPNGKMWYIDIKIYLEKREYPKGVTSGQKKTIRRMENGLFLNKEVLYKRTPDLGLLRCADASEATKLL